MSILQDILHFLNYTDIKIWKDKKGFREEDMHYPDLATIPANSTLEDGVSDFNQFGLLFEVEPQVVSKGAHLQTSYLVSRGEGGISQWIQWLYREEHKNLKYKFGAVTDYNYWVMLMGVKKEDYWVVYETKHFSLLDSTSSLQSLTNLCELFVMEKEFRGK